MKPGFGLVYPKNTRNCAAVDILNRDIDTNIYADIHVQIPKTCDYRPKQSTIRHKLSMQKEAAKNSSNIQQGENFDKDIATAESNIEKLKKVIERLERNDIIVTEIHDNGNDNGNRVQESDEIMEKEENTVFKDAHVNLKRILLQNYIVPTNSNSYDITNEFRDGPSNINENSALKNNETNPEKHGKVIIEINTENDEESTHNKITIKEHDNTEEKVVFKEAYVNLRRLLLDKYATNIDEPHTEENIETNNNIRVYLKTKHDIDNIVHETDKNTDSIPGLPKAADPVDNESGFSLAVKQQFDDLIPGTSDGLKGVVYEAKKESEGVKGDKKHVLTHVIDGFIIQESSYPFPVQKTFPLMTTSSALEQISTQYTAEDLEEQIIEVNKNLNAPEQYSTESIAEEVENKIINYNENLDSIDHISTQSTAEDVQENIIEVNENFNAPEEPITEYTAEETEEKIVEVNEYFNVPEQISTESTSADLEEQIISENENLDAPEQYNPQSIAEDEIENFNAPEQISTESTAEDEIENLNPFRRLQHSLVKTWTTADLSNHLLNFGWTDAASILSDNEIDGESLFMVSKSQLILIGIEEDQADCIEEFLQGGPK